MEPDESFPGALQIVRRLDISGRSNAALHLLTRLAWFDPDLLWVRADMAAVPDAAAFAEAAESPLATTDLRSREGMLSSWDALDALAMPLEPVLRAFLADGWGEGPLALILSETILRLRPQGRITERTTRVYHLRTQQAAQDWTDFQIHDTDQVIRLRVRGSDGTWREPAALGAGDLANLGGLAAGDVVVMETINELEPFFALEEELCLPVFHFSYRDVPVWCSRLVVRNETDLRLETARFWGAPPPFDLDPQTRVFEARRIEIAPPEGALQRWDAGLPRVEICTRGMSWTRFRDQLSDRLLGQLTPDPAVRRLAATLAAREDPVRAAFDEVRGTIAADNGDLFTRNAPEILAEREGAPALLLLALLVEMDVPAALVLVDPAGGAAAARPGHADPGVHTEPVVRARWRGRTLWLDPFGPAARFAALRPFLGGRPALLLELGAPHLRVRTPRAEHEDHSTRVRWDVRVRPDGGADADFRIRFSGIAGSSLRERFGAIPEERLQETIASFTQSFFPAARPGDHAMRYERGVLRFQVPVTFPPGTFDEPVLLRLGAGTLGRRYASRSRRVLPILVDGEALTRVEVHITAPTGRRIAPKGSRDSVVTDFGLHETTWTTGRRLTIRHASHLVDRLLPASRYDELVRFATAADAMDRVVLVPEATR